MLTNKLIWISFGVFTVGCINLGQTPDRIEVGNNDLGVAALEIVHIDDPSDSVFELRGLDAANQEVAKVRRHVGTIADLPDYLSGTGTYGSEIMLSLVGEDDQRIVSREVQRYELTQSIRPAFAKFLNLDAVSSTLATDANIIVGQQAGGNVDGETAYNVGTCAASQVNTSPLAEQCCFTNASLGTYTLFYVSSGTPRYIGRAYGRGYVCAAQNGGACSGAACYWGPNGFARPSATNVVNTYRTFVYAYVQNGGQQTACEASDSTNPPAIVFSDVTGTFATNQGCPGGDSGAGQWDY